MLLMLLITILTAPLALPGALFTQVAEDGELASCGEREDNGVCLLPDRSKDMLSVDMKESIVTYWGEGDRLYIAARGLPAKLRLCCSVRATLHPVPQSDIQTLSIHFPDLQAKSFPIRLYSGESLIMESMWMPKGVSNGQAPQIEDREISTINGKYYFSIYKPRKFDPSQPYDIVYLADGQGLKGFVAPMDELISTGKIRSTVVVGLWSNFRTREKVFLYNSSSDNEAFSEYLSNILRGVVPEVESDISSLPPQHRIVSGFSNGADWALTVHALRPAIFPWVIALSAVSSESVKIQPTKDSTGRYYVATGIHEEHGMRVHEELNAAVKRNKAHSCFRTPDYGHSGIMWSEQFISGLKWMNDGKCID